MERLDTQIVGCGRENQRKPQEDEKGSNYRKSTDLAMITDSDKIKSRRSILGMIIRLSLKGIRRTLLKSKQENGSVR